MARSQKNTLSTHDLQRSMVMVVLFLGTPLAIFASPIASYLQQVGAPGWVIWGVSALISVVIDLSIRLKRGENIGQALHDGANRIFKASTGVDIAAVTEEWVRTWKAKADSE